MPCFAWLILLFAGTNASQAQLLKRLNHVSYNVNEGLMQSHVADIAEDGNGFMWLSTGSGVQRFDGKRFHAVTPGTGNRALPEDKYVHFFRLANGNLWLTHSKGISEYDIHTNSFRKIYAFTSTTDSAAAGNLLYAMLEEPDAVWCVSPQGLVAISKHDGQITGVIPFPPSPSWSLISPLSPTKNFFVTTGRHICIFLAPSEIRLINTVTKDIRTVKADGQQRFFYAIEKLTDDTLLVASSRGLEKLSIVSGRFVFLCSYIVSPGSQVQRFPVHLHLMKQQLAVVTFSDQLYELDTRTGQYTAHLVNLQNQSFLNNGYVNGCMSDRYNNIWAVTVSDGIKKINYNFSGFRYFGTPEPKNNFVKSVYVDKSANRVFCGTFNSGLYIFDTAQQLVKHINFFPGAAPPYIVVAVDRIGVGQYIVYLSGGLDAYLLSLPGFSIRKIPVSTNRPGRADVFDFYLSLLKESDSVSIISSMLSLYRSRLANGRLQLQLLDTLPLQAICAYTDRLHRIWIGATGQYFLREGDRGPLLGYYLPGKILCRCFWNDRSGRMWLGTEKGLYRLGPDGKVQSALHKADGLPDDCIYAIREDREGNLWLSHNKGITCMAPNGSMLHFSRNDGLQENEFNTNTSFETPDGELYFGGVNGVSSFYPEEVGNITETPGVLLSGIKVNDDYWKEDTAWWSLQQLVLPYYNNILSFEFTALGRRNPDQYIYQYQVTGVDPDWVNMGIHPDPRYVLEPGRYSFRYYAGNSFEKNPRPFKELLVIIQPPFWKTWWFTALTGFLITCLLLGGIFAYGHRQKKRHSQELDTHLKIQQERERISRELHDNIGAQLSFISSSIDWISAPPRQLTKEEELRRLATINDTAKLVIGDLRETIWALKKESIQLDEMADRLKLFIQLQRTLQPGMEMTIAEDIQNNISFSSTEALNIFRICQEAIMNSIKHAQAGKLSVTIASGPGLFYVITIKDNGKGFSGAPHSEEHYGLENMQHRAAELGARLSIQSGEGRGTTLILSNKEDKI